MIANAFLENHNIILMCITEIRDAQQKSFLRKCLWYSYQGKVIKADRSYQFIATVSPIYVLPSRDSSLNSSKSTFRFYDMSV